jgi:hypothetical protein
MFFNEHNPPHFHAFYGEHEVLIDIQSLSVISGGLPPRATGLVIEWATQHKEELMADWARARSHEPLAAIEPLP